METNELKLKIVALEPQGLVELQVFLQFFEDARQAIRQLEQHLGIAEHSRLVVADLAMGSSQMTIAAVSGSPDSAGKVMTITASALSDLQNGRRPDGVNEDTIERLARLGSNLGKRLGSIVVEHRTVDAFRLTESFTRTAERLLATRMRAYGTVRGKLDSVNIHDPEKVLYIYPIAGRAKVKCKFPPDLLAQVSGALGHTVTIRGVLHYRSSEAQPHLVEVHEIDTHPPNDELPLLGSFRGAMPNLTGGMSTVEYLRELRGNDQ